MKRVVIIGAGPAGLTAARELLERKSDVSVTLLEESGEIGGISRTVRYGGHRMDIGGHRFFSKDPRVTTWWRDRMPLQGAPAMDDLQLGREKPLEPGGPDPEREDRVMLIRDRVSRIFSLGKFFDYPIRMKAQTFKNMGFVRTARAGASYLRAVVIKRPEHSLEDFYINRFGRVLYGMFFEKYTEKLWGRHPSVISADWGAQRVKGLSVLAILRDMLGKATGLSKTDVETSLIEQFWYPKYGPGQLWEIVADDVTRMGGDVRTFHRVRSILCEEGRIRAVSCDTPDGPVEIPCDECISSMPLNDLIAGMQGIHIPAETARIAQGLPYRDFITVGLLVRRLTLKNETALSTLGGIVPDCWIYIQEPGVRIGRIQVFNNWSPYLTPDPEQTVWIGLEYFCREGDDLWEMEDTPFVDMAVAELAEIGIIDPSDVLDSHRVRVKKAYPAYFDTYRDIQTLTAWLDTIPNLYCVGRNGQHRYNNMDHSMVTAFEAVDALLSGNPSRERIWNVNTEKEYHEEKAQ